MFCDSSPAFSTGYHPNKVPSATYATHFELMVISWSTPFLHKEFKAVEAQRKVLRAVCRRWRAIVDGEFSHMIVLGHKQLLSATYQGFIKPKRLQISVADIKLAGSFGVRTTDLRGLGSLHPEPISRAVLRNLSHLAINDASLSMNAWVDSLLIGSSSTGGSPVLSSTTLPDLAYLSVTWDVSTTDLQVPLQQLSVNLPLQYSIFEEDPSPHLRRSFSTIYKYSPC